jgi:hypothetical protein
MSKKVIKKIDENVAIREIEVLKHLEEKWKCRIEYVGMNVYSRVDGFIFKNNDIKGILEVKCRRQGLSWMKDYKSVIFSYKKIQIGSDLSRLLGVPFYIIIETCDKGIITFQVTTHDGTIVCPMNIRYNETKYPNQNNQSSNQTKSTTNAYLSLEDNKYCKIFKRDF